MRLSAGGRAEHDLYGSKNNTDLVLMRLSAGGRAEQKSIAKSQIYLVLMRLSAGGVLNEDTPGRTE